jgi:hypothetical protein
MANCSVIGCGPHARCVAASELGGGALACACEAPWGRSAEYVGESAGEAGELASWCDTNVVAISAMYSVAAGLFVVTLSVLLLITRSAAEARRSVPALVAIALCVSVTVPRSALNSDPPQIGVDMSYTVRYACANLALHLMVFAFVSKYVSFLRKQLQSIGVAVSASEQRLIKLAVQLLAAHEVYVVICVTPLLVLSAALGPETRLQLLRAATVADGLAKGAGCFFFQTLLSLTERQLVGFVKLESVLSAAREGSSAPSSINSSAAGATAPADAATRRVRRLVAGIRLARRYDLTFAMFSMPPMIICGAVASLTSALRYFVPFSTAVLSLAILVTTVTMYTRGARMRAHELPHKKTTTRLINSVPARPRSSGSHVSDGSKVSFFKASQLAAVAPEPTKRALAFAASAPDS